MTGMFLLLNFFTSVCSRKLCVGVSPMELSFFLKRWFHLFYIPWFQLTLTFLTSSFLYIPGGIKEFSRYYSELCENFGTPSDLSLSMDVSNGPSFGIPPPLTLLSSPLFPLPPYSPSHSDSSNQGFENEPPTQVLPFLYVGNARDANDPDLLRRLGISYILSVTTNGPQPFKNSSSPESKSSLTQLPNQEPEFHTKLIPVSDNLVENLTPYFEEACAFIGKSKNVYRFS